ncbi:imidazole glycerol phosphate synthase subunit HisH, partial [Candidatus Pelagibacter bacterium]|nr:imidazole glycerol phosphate synthase subunit HisH [Candidatus Pelagibacter bacterium]
VYITNEDKYLNKADLVVISGVGSFDAGINKLKSYKSFEIIQNRIEKNQLYVLGICLGMQLMLSESEEGNEKGLNWINGKVLKFKNIHSNKKFLKTHLGWNYISFTARESFFSSLDDKNKRFYFAHQYYAKLKDENNVLAYSNHNINFPSIINQNKLYGFQFHPEKSHEYGMKLFKIFLENIFDARK